MPYEKYSRESGSTRDKETTPPLAGAPESAVRLNQQGFTLIEIVIVVFVLGMLLAIGVPNYVRARAETHKNLCINNLRGVEAAKEQWALTDHKTQGEPANETEVNAFLKSGPPHCPAGGHYTYGGVGSTPTCSLAAKCGHTLPDTAEQLNPQPQEPEVTPVGTPSPTEIVQIRESESTWDKWRTKRRFTSPYRGGAKRR